MQALFRSHLSMLIPVIGDWCLTGSQIDCRRGSLGWWLCNDSGLLAKTNDRTPEYST